MCRYPRIPPVFIRIQIPHFEPNLWLYKIVRFWPQSPKRKLYASEVVSFWRIPTRLIQTAQKDIYFSADSVDFDQIENTTQLDAMGRRVILKLRPTKVDLSRPFLTLNAGIYKTTGEAQSKHGIPFSKHRPFVYASCLRRYLSEFLVIEYSPGVFMGISTRWGFRCQNTEIDS